LKRLIFTADDFGLSPAVNEAVERAHRTGVLTTASLMVGAEAARDAVDRARRLPTLRVGLHLVVVKGKLVSSPSSVPGLVDPTGQFSPHLVHAGIRFFSDRAVRQQLAREIRAQYEAFLGMGLPLDHVNAHCHMHLHPTVADMMLEAGREYGLRAVRFPNEPLLLSWRASRTGLVRKALSRALLRPWLSLLKGKLRQAGLRSNDFIFGLNDSGRMSLDLVLRFLSFLPVGTSEVYFHPALVQRAGPGAAAKGDRPREEFEALTAPSLRRALAAGGIQVTNFCDL
jgi:hopanoid biosynthesis associated protein HpnK